MEYVRAHAVLSNNGEKKTAVESFTFHKYIRRESCHDV